MNLYFTIYTQYNLRTIAFTTSFSVASSFSHARPTACTHIFPYIPCAALRRAPYSDAIPSVSTRYAYVVLCCMLACVLRTGNVDGVSQNGAHINTVYLTVNRFISNWFVELIPNINAIPNQLPRPFCTLSLGLRRRRHAPSSPWRSVCTLWFCGACAVTTLAP